MKLLIVSESYWPNVDGGALVQRRLAHGMRGRGHHVAVWAPGSRLGNYADEVDGIKVYREGSLATPNNPRYRFSYMPFLHAEGVIRAETPDVIHVMSPSQISIAALKAARRHGIPVMATNHVTPVNIILNAFSFELPKPVYTIVSNAIWRHIINFHNKVDVVTTPSPIALSYLQTHQLKPPTTVITNGLDTAEFYPGPSHINAVPVILYIGRHDIEKNLLTLLKAARILKDRISFRLETYGTGTELDTLRAYAVAHGLDMITFHGWVSDEDKLKAYQSADVFAITSPAELQSLVTMEAMACGLPVVAADAGALPNLVEDGKTGYLVPTHDAKQLADRLETLLKSPALRQEMGYAGLAVIRKNHSLEYSFNEYEKLYTQLVGHEPLAVPPA